MRHKNVNTRVEQLLASDEQYRNNSKALLLRFWKDEGVELTASQVFKFMGATPAESILRVRRDLKEAYPASEEVTEARYKKFKAFKDLYSKVKIRIRGDQDRSY